MSSTMYDSLMQQVQAYWDKQAADTLNNGSGLLNNALQNPYAQNVASGQFNNSFSNAQASLQIQAQAYAAQQQLLNNLYTWGDPPPRVPRPTTEYRALYHRERERAIEARSVTWV